MIKAKNISKSFGGIHAVHDVSFICEKGTILGLIGPNGSGKSTLMHVITNMLTRDAGSVSIKDGFGRTFQDVRVWEHMTVLENVLLMTQTRKIFASLFDYHSHEHTAREVLHRVGLSAYSDTHARHLSYGQRKLLEIARALATRAPNFFFDEPFAGLFPEMVEQVKSILLEERKRGASIVLIEHDMSVIRELCDRVIVLNAGEKIAEGEVSEVLSIPQVVEAYLGT